MPYFVKIAADARVVYLTASECVVKIAFHLIKRTRSGFHTENVDEQVKEWKGMKR